MTERRQAGPRGAKTTPLRIIGWREWVQLPDLHVTRIKAKIDTGARTSALHASHVLVSTRNGVQIAEFQIHPLQRNSRLTVVAEAEVLEFREVKSSTGQITRRPVIMTQVSMFGETFPIELTLAGRDTMSFRLLLGREALRRRFVVDPGRSYYGVRP